MLSFPGLKIETWGTQHRGDGLGETMSSVIEGRDNLERGLTAERSAAPAVGSLFLHGGLVATL